MKKNLLAIITLSVILVASISSCKQGPSTNVTLKSEMDTISYAFGASIAQNVQQNLRQSGVIADTMHVSMDYAKKISVETDQVKKDALAKEMRFKIDSLNKANVRGMEEFLSGFQAGINSRESESNYTAGLSLGNQIAHLAIPQMAEQFFPDDKDAKNKMDKNILAAAIAASLKKEKTLLADGQSYLMMKAQEMEQKAMQKRLEQGEANRVVGENFLAENKTKEGVVELESGIQYKIITEGNGPKPTLEDQVKCHYEGRLINGKVFDSSLERDEPAAFGLRGVIPGWTEILQLMPVGSKWEVYIPYDKAYGDQGAGEDIGSKETLIFTIELLDILGAK